jgi:hypothetical protein
MTSLRGNSTARGVQNFTTGKGMTKSVADAAVTNKVSIDHHPHDRALLCCATYIVLLFSINV